jgi:hypothetical protein
MGERSGDIITGLIGAGFIAWGFGLGYFDGVLIALGLRLIVRSTD